MTADTVTKLFDQTLPWRERLGEPRLRTFPEIILAVLAAAIEDAETVEAEGSTSAREQLSEEAGEDLHALCRQIGEAILTSGVHDQPRESLSQRITAALGTPDWLIVSSSRPLGSELIDDTELDAYADATPRGVLDKMTPREGRGAEATTEIFDETATVRCRVCGCTDWDCSQCIKTTGAPCSWVEPDLCSACVPTDPDQDGK
jgi:hypothetical protein